MPVLGGGGDVTPPHLSHACSRCVAAVTCSGHGQVGEGESIVGHTYIQLSSNKPINPYELHPYTQLGYQIQPCNYESSSKKNISTVA